jgi:hypothetical protein
MGMIGSSLVQMKPATNCFSLKNDSNNLKDLYADCYSHPANQTKAQIPI